MNSHEQKLEQYLNSFIINESQTNCKISYPRVKCCGSSKGLFCECQNLLIPKDDWPNVIQKGELNLPFDLDIILNDKKRSSSGFLGMVLLKASEGCRNDKLQQNRRNQDLKQYSTARIIDTLEGQEVPFYNQQHKDTNNIDKRVDECDSTYLLFPSDKSIPLSTVSNRIKKLVVIDCKWTKTSILKIPQLQNMQQVHLDGDFLPNESYFWRWHNAGKGRCSTLEAIYFAALQVFTNRKQQRQQPRQQQQEDDAIGDAKDDIENLIHLMWLFGIQRATTIETAKREGKPNPFTVEGKELQRSYRRLNKTIKGSEKHKRDVQEGKLLKMNRRNDEERKNLQNNECMF